MEGKNHVLRRIPKVDELLQEEKLTALFANHPKSRIVEATREIVDEMRRHILALDENEADFEGQAEDILCISREIMMEKIIKYINQKGQKNLRRVINGTGVILHTNLGRARLSARVSENIMQAAEGYCNLEYNVPSGTRGSRHAHAEKVMTEITGAEAVMAVNNNAAAVLLCLSALAKDGDILVSRGELVEIGGAFRVPDIIAQSGGHIAEVGTTNKTRIEDYERAILPGQTKAILKVHTSNYKIMGFTEETGLPALKKLAEKYDLPLIYDLGSGLMADLQDYGITEPTVKGGLKDGADIVLFSGDKLLGGPQSGIIAGKKKYIDIMKKHPLARALRIDKLTLAALEETFRCYLDEDKAIREIPVLTMIASGKEQLRTKAEKLAEAIREIAIDWNVIVQEEQSQIGGGAAPMLDLPTFAVSIDVPEISADRLEEQFRMQETPIITRIAKDKVLIDVRTVKMDEFKYILAAVENMI